MSHAPTQAVQHCEPLLRNMMEDLQAKGIWPYVQSIIDSMLKRRIELVEVYEEVHAMLAQTPRGLYIFWDVFVHSADGWNPEKNRRARRAREEQIGANARISELADQLAALLDRRDELHNYSGFGSNTQHHILDIVHEASEHNYHYESYVKDELAAVSAIEEACEEQRLRSRLVVFEIDSGATHQSFPGTNVLNE